MTVSLSKGRHYCDTYTWERMDCQPVVVTVNPEWNEYIVERLATCVNGEFDDVTLARRPARDVVSHVRIMK